MVELQYPGELLEIVFNLWDFGEELTIYLMNNEQHERARSSFHYWSHTFGNLPYQQSVPNQIPGKTNVHGPKRSFIERHPRDVRIDLRPYK